jgi:hypothetical protein
MVKLAFVGDHNHSFPSRKGEALRKKKIALIGEKGKKRFLGEKIGSIPYGEAPLYICAL